MSFENFPYTNYHNQNMDDILRELKRVREFQEQELTDEVKAFIREITGEDIRDIQAQITLINAAITKLESQKAYTEEFHRIVVDAVEGDDNNSGYPDIDGPVKTLDHAFDLIGTRPNAEIRLVPRGVSYELSRLISAGGELHLQSMESNTRVTVHVRGQIRYYNKYIHVTDIDFLLDDVMQLEGGGMMNAYRCSFTRAGGTGNAITLLGTVLQVHDNTVVTGGTNVWAGSTLVIPGATNVFQGSTDPIISLQSGSTLYVNGATMNNSGTGNTLEARFSSVRFNAGSGSAYNGTCRLATTDWIGDDPSTRFTGGLASNSNSYIINGTYHT